MSNEWSIKYENEALIFVARNSNEIMLAAQVTGADALAIAGSISREITGEYNVYRQGSVYTGPLRDLMVTGRDVWHSVFEAAFSYGFWNSRHEYYVESYNSSKDLALDAAPSVGQKLLYATLNDVGPGKIRVNTAITLLREYLAEHGSDDPFQLSQYANDYNKLADDLWESEPLAIKIAALYVKKAEDYFMR